MYVIVCKVKHRACRNWQGVVQWLGVALVAESTDIIFDVILKQVEIFSNKSARCYSAVLPRHGV